VIEVARPTPDGEVSRGTPLHRPVAFDEGRQILELHTETMLGPRRAGRQVRIMVTLPSEAAADYALVRALLKDGMDCARVNCAHDDAGTWARMIALVRRAQRELRQPCRVLMDLGGPKLRTGALPPGPRVLKCRPERDALGRTRAPARLWLTSADAPVLPAEGVPWLPVTADWLAALDVGDRIEWTDARGKKRSAPVTARGDGGAWLEVEATSYFVSGMRLRAQGPTKSRRPPEGEIGALPPLEGSLDLRPGDLLRVTAQAPAADSDPSVPAPGPARLEIPCTLPQVFADVRTGERIWLDDGRIGGLIESASADALEVRIRQAKQTGTRLRADKGINLPDSRLSISGLTPQDVDDLAFVARHADMVGLSFVRGPGDVEQLQSKLAHLRSRNLGIVLKIETRRALEKLPAVLMTAMRTHPIGVMIARGDLAVECGYERLPEAQEEILALCEAAHVPVIWATQVLENLTKQGLPSRAEVTDAATSVRAECVMLNKGPHILEAVRLLADILSRMEEHQRKKSALLGPLVLDELES
jgi:pyruvate kinase